MGESGPNSVELRPTSGILAQHWPTSGQLWSTFDRHRLAVTENGGQLWSISGQSWATMSLTLDESGPHTRWKSDKQRTKSPRIAQHPRNSAHIARNGAEIGRCHGRTRANLGDHVRDDFAQDIDANLNTISHHLGARATFGRRSWVPRATCENLQTTLGARRHRRVPLSGAHGKHPLGDVQVPHPLCLSGAAGLPV